MLFNSERFVMGYRGSSTRRFVEQRRHRFSDMNVAAALAKAQNGDRPIRGTSSRDDRLKAAEASDIRPGKEVKTPSGTVWYRVLRVRTEDGNLDVEGLSMPISPISVDVR